MKGTDSLPFPKYSMKKGISSLIAIIFLILLAIAVSASFFYWFTNTQTNSQGRTLESYSNTALTLYTESEDLVDALYTTIEEEDVNAYGDFRTNICNTGKTKIDLRSQKGIQIKSVDSGKIVCAESVFDNVCRTSQSNIVAGLSFAGATTSPDTPPAIIYSLNGRTWIESSGISTTENVMDLAQYAVKPNGEAPLNFWAVSNNTNSIGGDEGRVTWSENIEIWRVRNISGQAGYSLAVDSINNKLYVGANDDPGAGIYKVSPNFTNEGVGINITLLESLTSGAADNFDGVLAMFTNGSVYLAGTGANTGTGLATELGQVYRATAPNWSADATEPLAILVPGKPQKINDFAQSSDRIYAGTLYDSFKGSSKSEVIYSDDIGVTWSPTGFNSTISSTADIKTLLDDPSASGNEVYAGYNGVGGFANISHYDGTSWTKGLMNWSGAKVYDLTVDTSTGYFYAALGNTTSNRAEIWRSGPSYNDKNWTRVYSNSERGAATSISVIDQCTLKNPVCVEGCDQVVHPGECKDIRIALEGSTCDIRKYSADSCFLVVANIGRRFVRGYHFCKEQDPPGTVVNGDGAYSPSNSPPNIDSLVLVLNATDHPLNKTTANLTVYATFDNPDPDGNTVTAIYDWRINDTSIALVNFPFDTKNTTGTKDYSTFGNYGSLSGASWISSGINNGAYAFDGVNDYIQTNDVTLTLLNFTFAAWFKTTDSDGSKIPPGGSMAILSIADDDALGTPWIKLDIAKVGTVSCRHNVGVLEEYVTKEMNYTNGKWHYAVCKRKGNSLSVCVDGNCSTSTLTFTTPVVVTADAFQVGRLKIGTLPPTDYSYFNGSIDEVRIYNRSLSNTQINATYNEGVPKYNITDSNETRIANKWTVAVTLTDSNEDSAMQTTNSVEIQP